MLRLIAISRPASHMKLRAQISNCRVGIAVNPYGYLLSYIVKMCKRDSFEYSGTPVLC